MTRPTVRRWIGALRRTDPRRVHVAPGVSGESPADPLWHGLLIRGDTACLLAARHLPVVPLRLFQDDGL